MKQFRFRHLAQSYLLIFAVAGCKAKSDSIIPAYNNYQFDTAVIKKLPLYDSLAAAISGKIGLFHKSIDENAAYHAFRYMPSSTEKEVFKTLPPEIGINMQQYFDTIGKDFIYGFDIFKDSTIKIYIRNHRLEKSEVDISENLSYYPKETNIGSREYPDKDTVLNKHWQYWTRFSKEGLF